MDGIIAKKYKLHRAGFDTFQLQHETAELTEDEEAELDDGATIF